MQKPVSILLFLITHFLNGRSSAEHVCSLDGVLRKRESVLAKCTPVDRKDGLYYYLNQVRKALNMSYSEYVLFDLDTYKTACSFEYTDSFSNTKRAIAINKKYYNNLYGMWKMPQAPLIWVIAHQITHHINHDYYNKDQDNEFLNYCNELICDENAGYLIAKLTDNVSIEDLDFLVFSILKNDSIAKASILGRKPESVYYPEIQYRILAAKAGWMRGKTENWTANDIVQKVAGTQLKKYSKTYHVTINKTSTVTRNDSAEVITESHDDGMIIFGDSKHAGTLNGKALIFTRMRGFVPAWRDFNFGKFTKLVFGTFKNNELQNGIMLELNGRYIIKRRKNETVLDAECDYTNGDRYEGEYVLPNREGYGTYFYKDGKKYIGQWKNDKEEGMGILTKGDKVISQGYWCNGVFVNNKKDCE